MVVGRCRYCGGTPDLEQKRTNGVDKYYYCFACLSGDDNAGRRPFGWDYDRGIPDDVDGGEWRVRRIIRDFKDVRTLIFGGEA